MEINTGSKSTHLLVLYDDSGNITGVGRIDQEMMDREGLGQVKLESEDRHFAQLPVDDETRDASHEDLMTNFKVDHRNGKDASITRRDSAD